MIVATPHAEIASTDLDNLTEELNSDSTKITVQRPPVGYSGLLKTPNNSLRLQCYLAHITGLRCVCIYFLQISLSLVAH
jgi:hypothetical protein